jgi:hypothetical protein
MACCIGLLINTAFYVASWAWLFTGASGAPASWACWRIIDGYAVDAPARRSQALLPDPVVEPGRQPVVVPVHLPGVHRRAGHPERHHGGEFGRGGAAPGAGRLADLGGGQRLHERAALRHLGRSADRHAGAGLPGAHPAGWRAGHAQPGVPSWVWVPRGSLAALLVALFVAPLPSGPALVVLFLISLVGAYGLGFLFAGVALVFKRTEALVGLVFSLMIFLTGALVGWRAWGVVPGAAPGTAADLGDFDDAGRPCCLAIFKIVCQLSRGKLILLSLKAMSSYYIQSIINYTILNFIDNAYDNSD